MHSTYKNLLTSSNRGKNYWLDPIKYPGKFNTKSDNSDALFAAIVCSQHNDLTSLNTSKLIIND